ncbi:MULTISPECIES: IclR family transcriptional regulator [unclassified Crossiella]|uniref:IclR family transcriptional regulator n=1 Tax=unclassified Crossiella TaxID=2620835 RepID=UPI0020004F28|nr:MULTISPECIES: IclR family transcriptional regulator [unclassified Crossiella]MCK2241629.1 IclR family transcriptional regulator [Crossiella sp. S99.2]MCK2255499.1 IclR family transcriptional regulator [Crossiella sp. S99.1]
MSESESSGVRSVQRAVELLALYDAEHPSRTVRELTDATGLAKTTVVRLVHTLEQCGLLWSRGDGRTVPGPALLRWAELARSTWQLPEAALALLAELSQASGGEAVHLYVRQQRARVCIARQEGTRTLRHVVRVGAEMPLWSGAASHVLLSRAEQPDIAAIARQAPHENWAQTLAERARAAALTGWSVSHGEREEGVSGVAAPVFGRDGQVLAALALGGPTARFTETAVAGFGALLVDSARKLTALDCIGGVS